MNKRGFELEELGKIILIVVVLVLLVFVVLILFKGKGGDVFASIKNLLHFGRA